MKDGYWKLINPEITSLITACAWRLWEGHVFTPVCLLTRGYFLYRSCLVGDTCCTVWAGPVWGVPSDHVWGTLPTFQTGPGESSRPDWISLWFATSLARRTFLIFIVAGSLESAYWLLRGAHSFHGNCWWGAFGSFMISRPSLSSIHWLEFVYTEWITSFWMSFCNVTTSRGSIWTVFMTSSF